MIAYTSHEKKLFWIFKIWYGKTGYNGEQSLATGISRNKSGGKVLCALCFNLIFVYFNIGWERDIQ